MIGHLAGGAGGVGTVDHDLLIRVEKAFSIFRLVDVQRAWNVFSAERPIAEPRLTGIHLRWQPNLKAGSARLGKHLDVPAVFVDNDAVTDVEATIQSPS